MQSLDFYQATLDSIKTTIAIVDRNGEILFVNRSWRAFAADNGADREQVSEGCNYFSICESSAANGCAEARSFIDQAKKVLRGEMEEFVLEYSCHSPNRQRWFQVRVTRLQHERGDRFVAAHEDLTPIKRAQLELANREILLNTIVNVSPNLVFIKDRADRYLIANEALAEMYGMKAEEMVGRVDVELMAERELPSVEQEQFQRDDRWVFENETQLFIDEEPFTDCRGTRRWFRTVKAPIIIDGEVRYLVGIANDITRDREQQQAVRTTQLRLQTILDAVNQEIVLFDTDARVVWANERACRAISLTLDDCFGRPCGGVYCGVRHAPDDCPVHGVLAGVGVQRRTFTTKTGATLAVTASPVVDDGRTLIGAVLVAEDISERLSLEQQLRQAQKLESLGTLAGGIAHDFNNILTSVLGFTELCLDRATDPDMREDLGEVYQASLRARDLVHQILTFSRRAEQETRPLDIALIVKEAVKLLRSTLPSTIEIKSRFARDVGTVLADPARVHQILMNLCTNAAHAMRESGGILSLSLDTHVADDDDRVQYQLTAGRAYVRLTVGDTGCGMEREIIPSIFDPYFTTKQQGEGTGLGLAIVHGIVRDYDGAIGVVSIPGHGSTFTVYLPLFIDEQHESERKRNNTLSRGSGESLLIVDDEAGITRLTRKILEGVGYRVHTENDSVQALTLIREKRLHIDLLISDMTMPQLTGEKLALEVRQVFPDLPIILVSGNTMRIPESLVGCSGIDVLAKPMDRERLLTAISHLLNSGARHH